MFTTKEEQIYDHLVDAHNLFVTLGEMHPKDIEDFSNLIRLLQNIMLSRVACRKLGWSFNENGVRIVDGISKD